MGHLSHLHVTCNTSSLPISYQMNALYCSSKGRMDINTALQKGEWISILLFKRENGYQYCSSKGRVDINTALQKGEWISILLFKRENRLDIYINTVLQKGEWILILFFKRENGYQYCSSKGRMDINTALQKGE